VALDTPDGLRRRAFGGDLVDVRPERGWLTGAEVEKLAAEPFVLRAQRTADGARLVVADSAAATPLLAEDLRQLAIGQVAIDQVTPDYDDIFVALMRASDAAACAVPA